MKSIEAELGNLRVAMERVEVAVMAVDWAPKDSQVNFHFFHSNHFSAWANFCICDELNWRCLLSSYKTQLNCTRGILRNFDDDFGNKRSQSDPMYCCGDDFAV